MKTKTILSLLFAGILLSTYAEEKEYHPLVDENLTWSYCDVIKREVDEYDINYNQTYFIGDTTINGKTYKKAYESQCGEQTKYLAALREDGKRVYIINDRLSDKEEHLIYDFDLEEGDVAPNPYSAPEIVIVAKTDSIDTAEGRRKRIIMPGDTWIEGIGSIERNFTAPLSPVSLYDLGIRINYQKRGTQFTYKTDGFWLKEDDCEPSKVEAIQTALPISITQPEPNVLCIVANEAETFELKIYNLSGQQQQSILGKSGEHIDIAFLSAGIYMLNVNGKAVQKIIKQ